MTKETTLNTLKENILDTLFKTIFYAIFLKLHWYLTLAINLKGGDLINYSKLLQELEVGLSFYALGPPDRYKSSLP